MEQDDEKNNENITTTTTTASTTSPLSSTTNINEPAQPIRITPDSKIVVYFKNAGGAQPLKQKKFKIQANVSFQNVIDKLRTQLKLKSNEPLFLFINQIFQPSPDDILGELYKCFHHNDQLIVTYGLVPMWG